MSPDFPVSPEKQRALAERMERLGVREEDIEEAFIRASGPGGQKVNKTSSCVQLLHRPTGTLVKCQESRSQALNRFLARQVLIGRIEERVLGEESARRREAARIRRQKRKRSQQARQKMLEDKHRRAEVRAARRRPDAEE